MATNNKTIKDLSVEEINAEIKNLQTEYQSLKFEHALKGIANPLEIRAVRRDIARMQTELRSRDIATMTPEQLANRSKIRARRTKR